MNTASTFYPNSVLPLPSFNRPNSAISILSPKDGSFPFYTQREHQRLTVSSTRSDGDRQGQRPRKGRASGRTSKDSKNETPGSADSTSSSSSNQDDIIALFRRIQSSISKGESVNNEKSSKSPEDTSAESVLEVLRQSRNQGRASNKDPDEAFTSQKATPKNIEKIQGKPFALDLKKTRPPSNFVKRSPIPQPTSPRGRISEKRNKTSLTEAYGEEPVRTDERNEPHFTVKGGEETTGLNAMKLTELKELAKLRGIKGYSKLKKGELLELLKDRV